MEGIVQALGTAFEKALGIDITPRVAGTEKISVAGAYKWGKDGFGEVVEKGQIREWAVCKQTEFAPDQFLCLCIYSFSLCSHEPINVFSKRRLCIMKSDLQGSKLWNQKD